MYVYFLKSVFQFNITIKIAEGRHSVMTNKRTEVIALIKLINRPKLSIKYPFRLKTNISTINKLIKAVNTLDGFLDFIFLLSRTPKIEPRISPM